MGSLMSADSANDVADGLVRESAITGQIDGDERDLAPVRWQEGAERGDVLCVQPVERRVCFAGATLVEPEARRQSAQEARLLGFVERVEPIEEERARRVERDTLEPQGDILGQLDITDDIARDALGDPHTCNIGRQ